VSSFLDLLGRVVKGLVEQAFTDLWQGTLGATAKFFVKRLLGKALYDWETRNYYDKNGNLILVADHDGKYYVEQEYIMDIRTRSRAVRFMRKLVSGLSPVPLLKHEPSLFFKGTLKRTTKPREITYFSSVTTEATGIINKLYGNEIWKAVKRAANNLPEDLTIEEGKNLSDMINILRRAKSGGLRISFDLIATGHGQNSFISKVLSKYQTDKLNLGNIKPEGSRKNDKSFLRRSLKRAAVTYVAFESGIKGDELEKRLKSIKWWF
jgi:hypothetical protein